MRLHIRTVSSGSTHVYTCSLHIIGTIRLNDLIIRKYTGWPVLWRLASAGSRVQFYLLGHSLACLMDHYGRNKLESRTVLLRSGKYSTLGYHSLSAILLSFTNGWGAVVDENRRENAWMFGTKAIEDWRIWLLDNDWQWLTNVQCGKIRDLCSCEDVLFLSLQ